MGRSVFSGPPKPGDDDICGQCRQPRHMHCEFVEVTLPPGCKCEELEGWSTFPVIPAICTCYVGDGEDFCETCEHEKQCHQVAAPKIPTQVC